MWRGQPVSCFAGQGIAGHAVWGSWVAEGSSVLEGTVVQCLGGSSRAPHSDGANLDLVMILWAGDRCSSRRWMNL